MRFRCAALAAGTLLTSARHAAAVSLDINSPASIKAAASTIAHSMMQWYPGNLTGGVPGLLGGSYYWWEGGAVMANLIDYWYYTGEETYNDIVSQAILWQASPTLDFMPANQTEDEGNDDQVYWGFTAMTAAEYQFPDPPADQPQWLELAEGVWNSQQLRWDTTSCGGGLRWQIFTWNTGYGYKNSPSNAGFINLGARLYAYTGNQTYADWVVKTWDWMTEVGLIGGRGGYNIYDGTNTDTNCSSVNDYIQWSYTAGMMLNAAAVMSFKTGDSLWTDRANGIWASSAIFFKDQVMVEVACESRNTCDLDQTFFKASLARFMAASTKWMPSLLSQFQPYFTTSAQAAAAQCDGTVAGLYGNACGFKWTQGSAWDNTYGFGQQVDALEIILANLIQSARDPVTAATGGTSKGNPSAGTGGDGVVSHYLGTITTASKAGAGILTAFMIIAWLTAIWWMYV